MTISGISSQPRLDATQMSQDRDAFRQLIDAIQTGDLSAAQQAYGAITQGGAAPGAQSALGQDFASIGQALSAGDVTGAQQALDTLKADAAKLHRGGHHHHRHHQTAPTDPASTPTDPAVGTTISVKV